MKKTKLIHILIIIAGIIFITIPAIHSNIWFDESYSVAIANKSFKEIWTITGNDVHPALYYWLLHILYLIFGSNIIIYRLFSVVGFAILGIIGYTHIRKDFGEKTGIIFSYLTFFLPIMNTFAGEIRMYSWSCLIVTLTAIYAYRLYKSIKMKEEKNQFKNLCIFGVFSICCCYIHYYALGTTCLINLILLIYLKNKKEYNKQLKNFLILAAIQIIVYIPWLIYLVGQIAHVGGGFWITIEPIKTTMEILSLQFRREQDIDSIFSFQTIIAFSVAVLMYVYIGIKIYKLKKEKEDVMPAILSILVYIGVIIIVSLISIKVQLLYARYLIVMTGLYIFAISFILSKEKNKIITYIICAIILILGIFSNYSNSKINYDSSNSAMYEYIAEEIQEDDIIIYSNIINGGVVAALFPEIGQYFINFDNWNVEEAYKAFGPGMETVSNLEFLENYTGRIWIIDSEDMELYNKLEEENIEILKEAKTITTAYHSYVYTIMLIEKNN